ncbi:MAG: hypothetical protein Q3972_09065 [Corynebacterium sp.]|nr:hypothetical protein [Corynebacterium sp.]
MKPALHLAGLLIPAFLATSLPAPAQAESLCVVEVDEDTTATVERTLLPAAARLSSAYALHVYSAMPPAYLIHPDDFTPSLHDLWLLMNSPLPLSTWERIDAPSTIIALLPETHVLRTNATLATYASTSWPVLLGAYALTQSLTDEGRAALAASEQDSITFVNLMHRAIAASGLDQIWREVSAGIAQAANTCSEQAANPRTYTQADLLAAQDSGLIGYADRSEYSTTIQNRSGFALSADRVLRFTLLPGMLLRAFWNLIAPWIGSS